MKMLRKDLPASIAVFLVALPLCLGIALASGAPLMSGLIAGIVGGLVVGSLSGSHISVSGPAAGLVAIVLAALAELGSFELFLVAVILCGVIQLGLGLVQAGGIAHYMPSAVIRGLLAAIGIILILKQLPHAAGYDADAEGDFSFFQSDGENTFSELLRLFESFEIGAIIIAAACFFLFWVWRRSKTLSALPVPVQLAVVVGGIAINQLYAAVDSGLWLESSHRVTLPDFDGITGFFATLSKPDMAGFSDPRVLMVAVTLALVASLETLLNLEAADKLDPHKRVSPPNRELLAQGVGNIASGFLGGLPVTSVVVRSSVNAYSGAETRQAAILHAAWLLLAVLFVPGLLRLVPLSALAVILIVTGFKLASPAVFREMWRKGWSQFLPFVATVVAIVFTDLLIGVLIGLAIGIASVVRNLISTPFLSRTPANPEVGHPERIKFAQQLTFLHRARLIKAFESIESGSAIVLDATSTETIDADVLEVIHDFRDVQCKERNIELSLVGFRDRFGMTDQANYVDVFTRDRQKELTPNDALEILRAGNQRFIDGAPLERDLLRQVQLTAEQQHPLAAVLACIDSRVPTEILFDKGLGDIFSVRVAGNVLSDEVIASLEFAAEVAGVKVVVVLGHTGCGAIKAACGEVNIGHIPKLLEHLKPVVKASRSAHPKMDKDSPAFYTEVSRANVAHVLADLFDRSLVLRTRVDEGKLAMVGALYEIESGRVVFAKDAAEAKPRDSKQRAS